MKLFFRDTVPETFFFPTCEHWANGKRKANARSTNSERTQSEWFLNAERKLVNDMWTFTDGRTRNANGVQTRAQCERWTHDECLIREVSGISLALYLTSNLVRIYMYELLHFRILSKHIYFYKRTAWNRNE